MRVFRVKYLILWLFFYCPAYGLLAQTDNINFTSITVKDGLSSNTVYSIIKDRFGLMWFGTANGVCRFDGTNFTLYRHSPGKANMLSGNDVLALTEDHDGKIWIGIGAGGISYYDRQTDKIISYKGNGSWPELSHISPRAILQDHRNQLWIGTYGDLRTINLQTGAATSMHFQNAGKKSDGFFAVLSLFEDSRHRMWVGTNNGLYLYNWQNRSFTKYVNNPADSSSLSNNIIKNIVEDKKGNLWFATFGGLNKLLPDGHFKIYRHQNGNSNSISSDAVFAMGLDNDSKLWIGTEDGVDIFDPSSGLFRILKTDPRNAFSLKSKSIRSVFIDPCGIYWIGTFSGGIAKYDRNLPLFNIKQSDPFDPFGLKSSIVYAFAEYGDGSVFVGSDGGGVALFNRKTGLLKPINIVSRLHKNADGITVFSLYLDHLGFLWVGTYHDGLFRVDVKTGQYQQFISNGTSNSLSDNDITSVTEDGQGQLWIGTLGGGVNIYNLRDHCFYWFDSNVSPNLASQRVPMNAFISSIVKSPRNEMWIASNGSGVFVFDPKTKTTRHYTMAQAHLPSDAVNSLFFDNDGTLWLSTEGGICSMDTENQRMVTYTEKDGLASSMVKSIVEDKAGLLWLSTDRGISTFDKIRKQFRNFNSENGVQQGAFSVGASLRASNGDIYFGGRDGFNFFNPKLLPQKASPGPVLLTDLKVSNQSVTPAEDGPIKEQIGIAKEIRLKYGLNFSIGYVALNYTSPKQNQFAYKLVGFEKDWNYVHRSHNANYTNIDPGIYTFQVKASSDGLNWDSVPTEIKVIIFPPFWRTGYAYGVYILMLGIFLYLLRRRGIEKLRKEFELKQEKLQIRQMIEQERREAEQLHELDLLKIKFLTDLSHEFRTPISLILAPVEKLLQNEQAGHSLDDIRMINRNAKRLLNMVNQLLDFLKMEEQELHLNLQPGDIIIFIMETGDSFKDLAAKKKIRFSVDTDRDSLFVCFDHDKLERIIFNLLSNAFKFTPPGGKVVLEITFRDIPAASPVTVITVTDTGVGIPEQDITRIFDRFYQHQNNAILNQGTGIGLSITKEFIELHGGKVAVESTVGKGTRFVIELPLSRVDENQSVCESSVVPPNPETPEESVELFELSTAVAEKKMTVLLVEDNDEFRTYLADHLKDNYRILEATNGKEGWQKTLSAHPQLVVSDINMPFITGIELSKKIKEDKRTCHIPVILLTAMTGESEQLKGLQSGASDYLSKPFNFQILNTKIGNLLNLNKNVKNTYSKQIQIVGNEVVTESANLRLLNSVMKFIEDKISEPDLSVEELSKHVGMSRGSLYYKLIELTGLTPIEYIRTVKLEKAAALLENSELNVAQIAYMTGFGTPSYFSRMFKNKFGMVPSEYLISKRNTAKISFITGN